MTSSTQPVDVPVRHEDSTIGGSADEPYRVILYNDDTHAFDAVLLQVQKATGVSAEEAFAITLRAHEMGRAACYAGSHETCKRVAAILREIALQVEVDRA